MKAITLRGLSPAIAGEVKRRSREKGWSLNRTVIAMLEEAVGVHRSKEIKVHHDLDHLAGTWSRERAEEMERFLAEQRQIEPEMWK